MSLIYIHIEDSGDFFVQKFKVGIKWTNLVLTFLQIKLWYLFFKHNFNGPFLTVCYI